jgi:transposase
LAVLISAANRNDHLLLDELIDAVPAVRRPVGRPRRRPAKLHADKGYDHRRCRASLRRRGITARIARKGIESSTRLGRHRYVIERALEWLTRFRRLARRHDRIGAHFEAFAVLACAVICYRRTIRTGVLLNNPN